MKKIVPILILLIALNLLLGLLTVYTGTMTDWITFILVAVIGILLFAKKE